MQSTSTTKADRTAEVAPPVVPAAPWRVVTADVIRRHSESRRHSGSPSLVICRGIREAFGKHSGSAFAFIIIRSNGCVRSGFSLPMPIVKGRIGVGLGRWHYRYPDRQAASAFFHHPRPTPVSMLGVRHLAQCAFMKKSLRLAIAAHTRPP